MSIIDTTLEYLRESLANYGDSRLGRQISQRLESADYAGEGDFVKALNGEEMGYLNDVLEQEIGYARNVQNDQRVMQLNEVYELLY